MGRCPHHIEILPPQTKSQHVQPGPCGFHPPARNPETHLQPPEPPHRVTFRAVALVQELAGGEEGLHRNQLTHSAAQVHSVTLLPRVLS